MPRIIWSLQNCQSDTSPNQVCGDLARLGESHKLTCPTNWPTPPSNMKAPTTRLTMRLGKVSSAQLALRDCLAELKRTKYRRSPSCAQIFKALIRRRSRREPRDAGGRPELMKTNSCLESWSKGCGLRLLRKRGWNDVQPRRADHRTSTMRQ